MYSFSVGTVFKRGLWEMRTLENFCPNISAFRWFWQIKY